MDLRKLQQRETTLKATLAEKKKARAAIGTAAMSREDNKLTDAEKKQFLALGTEIDDLQAQLEENDLLLSAAKEAQAADLAYRGSTVDADAEAARLAAASGGVPQIRVGDDLKAKAPGYFGRQLQAVHKIAVARGDLSQLSADDRDALRPMMAVATGANSDVGSEGGFLVGQERTASVRERMYETGQILSRVNVLPIGPNSNGMLIPAIDETSRANNSRYGGIVSGWLGQGGTLTAGKPKFRMMDLKLRKVGGFVYATDELLGDAVALENWVNANLPKELTFRVENAVVNGVGSTEPLGLLNGGGLVTVTRALAAHIKSADLRGMWKRMWAPARQDAVWLYDQSIEDDLDELGIAIGTAGVLDPSYKAAGSVPGQVYATYKGRPMIPVEHCANIGTTGDLILWSPSDYQAIDKGGIQQAVSIHVAFLTDEQVFRFIYRIDGQPVSNATLTPKSGGNALSLGAVVLS